MCFSLTLSSTTVASHHLSSWVWTLPTGPVKFYLKILTCPCWAGMLVGVLLAGCLVSVVYSWTLKEYKKTSLITPEMRLWYAILGGSLAVPISLFWMGWSSNLSALIQAVFLLPVIFNHLHSILYLAVHFNLVSTGRLCSFGYGVTTIFLLAYMYLIDSYDIYAASTLGFLVFTRYLVAGGDYYCWQSNISLDWRSLYAHDTRLDQWFFATYLLFLYGSRIRKHSKYAVNTGAG